MSQAPLVISIHMEKCGGTSFEQVLREQYDGGFFLYDPGLPGESEPSIPSDVTCLHGHMFYGLHERFPDRDCQYITLLRDPLERFMSNFEHIRRFEHPLHELVQGPSGLARFCQADESRHYRNLFTRRLAGARDNVGSDAVQTAWERINAFAAVGQLGQVDRYLEQCAEQLAWSSRPKLPRKNFAPTRPPLLTDKERTMIQAANQLDIDLLSQLTFG